MTDNLLNFAGPTTRTDETVVRYRRTYIQLLDRAAKRIECKASKLDITIRWFLENTCWSRSTKRQYKAALIQAAIDFNNAGLIHTDALMRHLYDLRSLHKNTTNDVPKRTSAKKRKTITSSELRSLLIYFENKKSSFSKIVAGMILFGTLIGLRPSEWSTSKLDDHEIIISNGKYSNGRAFGPERRLDLRDFGSKFVSNLQAFLKRLSELVVSAGGWQRVYSRAAKALSRACDDLNIKKICFYTLRHQFAANSKARFSKSEVAALMGHASDRTAGIHYAKRRSGWQVKNISRPSAKDILLIRHSQSTFDASDRNTFGRSPRLII